MANTTLKTQVPVFVSSTYEDMIPYRDAAQQVLTRLEQTVKGMEYFGSNPNEPLKVCLDAVKASDIYIAIIGMRYGSVEEETGKSYTQLEYETAIKNKIPTLIYIIGNDCPVLPKYVDIGEKADKLVAFKDTLKKKHTVSFFKSPEDFSSKLTQDIVEELGNLGKIEDNSELKQDMQRDFTEIYKKFVNRPKKYTDQEGTLTVKISGKPGILRPEISDATGMTYGDAISISAYVLDPETKKPIELYPASLVGEKEEGDWLEQIPPGTIASVKVRLCFVVFYEIKTYDGGSIKKMVSTKNLILLEAPKEESE